MARFLLCRTIFLVAMDVYLHPRVLSPTNWEMFETWAARADLFDLADTLLKVYLVAHREPDNLREVPRPPVIIQRADLDMYFTVKQTTCDNPRCWRCLERKCGYRFDWVGPWTCQCILGEAGMPNREIMARHRNCTICFPAVEEID